MLRTGAFAGQSSSSSIIRRGIVKSLKAWWIFSSTSLKVVIDKSGSNAAGLFNMNCLLVMHNWCWLIDVLQVKYLNNIIEQDHRFIKKITRPLQTFKSFNSAAATLAGIEVAHMIRKGQFDHPEQSGFELFADFAG